MINWYQNFVSSNAVCNQTHYYRIRIGLPLRGRPILFITRMILREAPSREVYNLVAREARVYHEHRKASVISFWETELDSTQSYYHYKQI